VRVFKVILKINYKGRWADKTLFWSKMVSSKKTTKFRIKSITMLNHSFMQDVPPSASVLETISQLMSALLESKLCIHNAWVVCSYGLYITLIILLAVSRSKESFSLRIRHLITKLDLLTARGRLSTLQTGWQFQSHFRDFYGICCVQQWSSWHSISRARVESTVGL
jgi:hypothetical protein